MIRSRWKPFFTILIAFLMLGCVAYFALAGVQQTRRNAITSTQRGRLCQLGLGVQSYSDTNNGLPAPRYNPLEIDFGTGEGLSWRVGVLQYLEQETLFKAFEKSQSWNSPANRPHAEQHLKNFEHLDDGTTTPDTRFQVLIGPGTLFDPASPRLILDTQSIPDGLSQTILLPEAAVPVPWACPLDVSYSPNAIPAIGLPKLGFILVCMADGRVKRIRKSIDPAILHALIQRNDGRALPQGWGD